MGLCLLTIQQSFFSSMEGSSSNWSELAGTSAAAANVVENSPSPTSPVATSGSRTRRRRNVSAAIDCCWTCRARKVRCPGNPGNGACTNCSRLELKCSFDDVADVSRHQGKISRSTPSRSHTEAGTLRRRAQRACRECHIHKTRCSGDLPRCKRCEAGGLMCEYTPTKRNFTSVSYTGIASGGEGEMAPTSSQDELAWTFTSTSLSERPPVHDESQIENLIAENELLNRDVVLRHLNTWFESIHPMQCYGFLHPAVTYRDLEEDRMSPVLSAAVCAVSSLFLSSGSEDRAFAERCNRVVKLQISSTTGIFSKQRLAYLVLTSLYDFMIGDWSKLWEYTATAARLVMALQLNVDTVGGSFIEQESARRLAWQVYLNDRILSGGFDEYVVLAHDKLLLSLPCSEQNFQDNKPVRTEPLRMDLDAASHHLESPSMRASYIKLFAIRREVLSFTKRFVTPTIPQHQMTPEPQPDPAAVIERIGQLQRQLDIVRETLPEAVRMTDASMREFASSKRWGPYFILHTWILQLHIDLYHIVLPGVREHANADALHRLPSDFIASAQEKAVAFAAVLARFWETSSILTQSAVGNGNPPQPLTPDPTFPACVVQTTKILLIAKQSRIFVNVHDYVNVATLLTERVNESIVDDLIESNMRVLDPYYQAMPKVEAMAREIQEIIANLTPTPTPHSTETDESHEMMGLPYVGSAESLDSLQQQHASQYGIEGLHTSHHASHDPEGVVMRRGNSSVLLEENAHRKAPATYGGFGAITTMGQPVDKSLNYAFAPQEVPFNISQVRTASPTPMMVTVMEPSRNPPPPPLQTAPFGSLGIPGPQMADTFGVLPPSALSQHAHQHAHPLPHPHQSQPQPMAHSAHVHATHASHAFTSSPHEHMFLGQAPPPPPPPPPAAGHFSLPPQQQQPQQLPPTQHQQMGMVLNYDGTYTKNEAYEGPYMKAEVSGDYNLQYHGFR